VSLTRLKKDLSELQGCPDLGIETHYNEQTPYEVKILISAGKESLYYPGRYTFTFKFDPANYPF
jgi:ubiquitin-protein ligase